MAGPNPTIAQIWTQLALLGDYVDERYQIGSENSPNIYDSYDALVTGLDGEFMPGMLRILNQDRRATAGLLTPRTLTSLYRFGVVESLRAANLPTRGGFENQLSRLIRYLHDTAELFTSRNVTFGSPAALTGNTGTGAWYRCTADRRGYDLECTGMETKTARVTADQLSGAREHREVWEFYGQTRARDALAWDGSGIRTSVTTADPLTGGVILNADFRSNDATADNSTPGSTTAVTNWTLSSAAAFRLRSTAARIFQGLPGVTTPYSLEFVDNGNFEQIIIDESPGKSMTRDAPWLALLPWQRNTTADGTLTIEVGSITNNVDVTTGTNGVWNVLRLADGQNQWYDNFEEQDLNVKVTLASNTTGEVTIGNVFLAPMVNVDGTYALPVGADTPFLIDDEVSWADSGDAGGRGHSYWIWRALEDAQRLQAMGGVWLPTTTNSTDVTIAD